MNKPLKLGAILPSSQPSGKLSVFSSKIIQILLNTHPVRRTKIQGVNIFQTWKLCILVIVNRSIHRFIQFAVNILGTGRNRLIFRCIFIDLRPADHRPVGVAGLPIPGFSSPSLSRTNLETVFFSDFASRFNCLTSSAVTRTGIGFLFRMDKYYHIKLDSQPISAIVYQSIELID